MSAENNGGKTGYYDIPKGVETLNDLIEYKNMKPWQHEVFKACYALQERALKGGGSEMREINKIIYYANRGLVLANEKRLYQAQQDTATIKHPWID